MENILVIDEDKICRRNIKYQLCDEGYCVTSLEYLDEITQSKGKYDLILLANKDRIDEYYIEYIKNYFNCAVILMSKAARADEIIRCMKSGADDFVLKPIREAELLAKVKLHMESMNQKGSKDEISGVIFDHAENTVMIQNMKIYLTKIEYRLCKVLAKNHLVTMTKERLYENIYELDTDTQMRTITEYIYSVRKKFKEVNLNPIKTVWGTGYRWVYEYEGEKGE